MSLRYPSLQDAVTALSDLTIADDLTVSDDGLISGDLTVTGTLASGALTVSRSNDAVAAVVSTMYNSNATAYANGAIFRAQFADTSANIVDGGYFQVYKEQVWTSTASTRDSSVAIWTCANGSMAVAVTFSSARVATFTGQIVASTAGIQTKHVAANISDPPLDAELDSAFGTPATVGAGFTGTIIDNSGGTKSYIVWSDGTNWLHAVGTVAGV